jgi:4-hydroxybenzoate polyprenyltransferase
MKVIARLENIISRLEGQKIPFSYYLLIFISSLTLRNFLEIFSDTAKVPFRLFPETSNLFFPAGYSIFISFAHYYVFWIFTFLGLAIFFSLLTKTNIVSVLKTLFSFSLIITITPLFDLLITKGRGLAITYAHPKNIFELFPLPNILTPGMLVTSLTAAFLTFVYCKIKTNKWTRGLWGAVILYSLLTFLSALPVVIKATHPLQIIRVLLIAIFFEFIIILFLANKVYFRAVFKDLRWLRIIHYLSMICFGILISRHALIKSIGANLSSFLLTVIAFILSWVGAMMLNDAEDYEIDLRSNQGRALVNNVVSKNELINWSSWLFLAAAIFALGVNSQTSFFVVLVIGNSCLYSLPPLRLKRVPIFSKLFISFSSLVLVMLGYLFAGGEILRFPPVVTWYFIVFVTLAMNLIDLKDVEGDTQAGIKTLPVIFGIRKAKIITGGFLFVAYFTLALILLDLRILLPAATLGIIQFMLINRKAFREKWVLLTHIAGMIALFSYLSSSLWLK